MLETKELSKRETIKIVEAYNLWYNSTNDDSSDSVNYIIEEELIENDIFDEP